MDFVDETPEEPKVIRVTYNGQTRQVEVNATERVEDLARAYGLDTRQYRFYNEANGALDLGDFLVEIDGVRIIQNPKGA